MRHQKEEKPIETKVGPYIETNTVLTNFQFTQKVFGQNL